MYNEPAFELARKKYHKVIRKYYSNVDEIVSLVSAGWEGCPQEILDASKECEREMQRLIREHYKHKGISYAI